MTWTRWQKLSASNLACSPAPLSTVYVYPRPTPPDPNRAARIGSAGSSPGYPRCRLSAGQKARKPSRLITSRSCGGSAQPSGDPAPHRRAGRRLLIRAGVEVPRPRRTPMHQAATRAKADRHRHVSNLIRAMAGGRGTACHQGHLHPRYLMASLD
jgi:hypothetical protein